MLPQIHAVPLSIFRKEMSGSLDLVTRAQGNLWLTRRGQAVASVVRMEDAQLLATLQGRSLPDLLHRIEVERDRIVAAKKLEQVLEICGSDWAYPPSSPRGPRG